MTWTIWKDIIIGSFNNLWAGFAKESPKIIGAFVIFIVGWIIASLLGKLVFRLVKILKVDDALRSTEVERVVNRAGFTLNIARLLGGLVEWFIIIASFIAAFEVVGLFQVNQFLLSVLNYIPNVIFVVVILAVAAIVGEFLQKVVRGSAAAAHMKSASLVGSVTKWAIWIFAIITSLAQLPPLAPFLDTLFMGFIVALAIAFGLAFGLGGQQAASEIIAKIRRGVDTN